MIPPPKPAAPAASPLRTPPKPPAEARATAFKALLMRLGKPKIPAQKASPMATSQKPSPEKLEKGSAPPKGTPGTAGVGEEKRAVADEEKPKARPKASPTEADLLDPTTRITAHLAAPIAPSQLASVENVAGRARVSLEELVPQVLRRIAWGGDRTKGSVHLELHSGEKVTVHAEGRRVRLEVEGNADLERRIGSRLRAAGIEVEGVR